MEPTIIRKIRNLFFIFVLFFINKSFSENFCSTCCENCSKIFCPNSKEITVETDSKEEEKEKEEQRRREKRRREKRRREKR